MKYLWLVLAGWLVFALGHSGVVAVRARMLAHHMEHFQPGKPPPVSNATFYTVDAILLIAAAILVIVGTVGALNKPRWKLALALLAVAIQFFLAYVAFIWLCFMVHIGVGGPL